MSENVQVNHDNRYYEVPDGRIEAHVALAIYDADVPGRGLRLLMAQRKASKALFPGCWECGGGKVKPGETYEGAALREMREEFGIEAGDVEVLPFRFEYFIPPRENDPSTHFTHCGVPGVVVPMVVKDRHAIRSVANHTLPEHDLIKWVGWFGSMEADGIRRHAIPGLIERQHEITEAVSKWLAQRAEPMHAIEHTQAEAVAYVEENFPQTVAEFRRIQDEQYQLFCLKQRRYGPGNIAVGQDPSTAQGQHAASVALAVRMNDKTNRLVNMLVVMNGEDAPEETLEDTFRDLSVYGVIAQVVKAGKWGK